MITRLLRDQARRLFWIWVLALSPFTVWGVMKTVPAETLFYMTMWTALWFRLLRVTEAQSGVLRVQRMLPLSTNAFSRTIWLTHVPLAALGGGAVTTLSALASSNNALILRAALAAGAIAGLNSALQLAEGIPRLLRFTRQSRATRFCRAMLGCLILALAVAVLWQSITRITAVRLLTSWTFVTHYKSTS